MMKYGQTIKTNGSSWGVHQCDTFEEARNKCIRFATMSGWTNPKWWQFWRSLVPKQWSCKHEYEEYRLPIWEITIPSGEVKTIASRKIFLCALCEKQQDNP